MAINNKKLLDELGVDKLIELLKSYTTNSVNTIKHSLDPPYTRGEIPPITKGVYDFTRANRLMFLPADQIIVEQSTDGGATWTSANASDETKRQMFSQFRSNAFYIPLKNGIRSCDCMLRVTITGMKYNVPYGTAETSRYNYWNANYVIDCERYCSLSGSFFWVNSVNDYIYCKYEAATGAAPNDWQLRGEGFMSGWSGLNYVKTTSGTFGGATSQTTNLWNHRYTFRTATIYNDFDDSKLQTSPNTNQQTIMEISAVGDNVWTAPNYMMQNNHIYGWDINGNMTLQKGLYVTDYIQTGSRVIAPIYYENGVALSNKYAAKSDLEEVQETLADYQDQFVAIGQELTEMDVDVTCDHRYEITGATGDEHNLAIEDQQMLINKISGRTLTKNQLFSFNLYSDTESNGVLFTKGNNGEFIANGTATSLSIPFGSRTIPIIANHKYCVLGCPNGGNSYTYRVLCSPAGATPNTEDIGNGAIFTALEDDVVYLSPLIAEGTTVNNLVFRPQLIDLTLAYQGNEPTTVEDVLNDFPEYTPYDEGTFIHSNNKLVSTGRNLWDEKWEIGWIDGNGNNADSNANFRSKNYISCLPNTEYYVKTDSASIAFRFYDNDKKLISISGVTANQKITTPENSYFMRFFSSPDGQSIYNNDICINVSDESFNGTYEPYKEEIVEVGELKQWDYIDNDSDEKVIGTGELDLGTLDWVYTTDDNGNPYFYSGTVSEIKPIPYSSFKGNIICSKYTNVPYIDLYYGDYKCIALVNQAPRIAIRDYSYTTVSSLKSALQGVKLLYEKATPTIVENYNLPAGYAVYKGGMQIQEGTIPYVIEKQYALSIRSQVTQNIEIDREQQKQIDSLNYSVIEAYTKSTLVEYNLNKAIVDYELPYLKDRITASNSRIKALEEWSGTIVGGGSGTVDLSNYVTIDTHNRLSGEVTDLEEYIREVDNTVEGIQELVNDFNSDISTLYNISQDLAEKEYPLDQIEYYVEEPGYNAIRLSHDAQINLYQIQDAFDIYLGGHRCILTNLPDDELTIYGNTSLSGSATIYNYANIPQSCFTWADKGGIGFEGLQSAGINSILVEFVNNCFIIRNVFVGEI